MFGRFYGRVVVLLFLGGLAGPAVSGCGTGGPPAALVGIWQAAFNDPNFGPGVVELILMSNGRFQQQTQYQLGALVTIYGTFRVFPEQTLLRLDIERGEPTQACGPLGCTNIIYPAGESHSYSLIDANTLILQNINCTPGPATLCVINYQRTG